MMTFEEEVEFFHKFLSHPAGFNIDFCDLLSIRPTDECSPPKTWEVSWIEVIDNIEVKYYDNFSNLSEAVLFFVAKRHQLQYGLDFESLEKDL